MVNVEVEVPVNPPSSRIFTTYVPGVADDEIARLQVSLVVVPDVEIPVHWICWVPEADRIRFAEIILLKFWPFTVRVTDSPRSLLVGLMLEIVGDAAPIVNALIMEVDWPSGFVT
jgi:hypothetical protein